MNDEYSSAANRALQYARRQATTRQAAELTPLDLLAGLLAEDESRAAQLLVRAGTNLEQLANVMGFAPVTSPETDKTVPTDPASPSAPQADPATMPVLTNTPLLQQVFNRAQAEALSAERHQLTDSAELLVSLLEEWPELGSALQQQGVDAQQVAQAYRAEQMPEPIAVPAGEWRLGREVRHEEIEVARILDANNNRACEALRVLEDYTRFVRDDARLARRLKTCRHDLRQALEVLPARYALSARDVRGDVGTALSTPDEHLRFNLKNVVIANCKRAQEAVRTLEEYVKLASEPTARRLENLRYQLYDLERLLGLGLFASQQLAQARLYWLADPAVCQAEIGWMIAEAAAGGLGMVQLRDKKAEDRQLLHWGRQFRAWTKQAGILLIINDRPDIARLVHADGVHLGQEDLPVKEARRILGPEALIGISTHSLEQGRQAVADGADYLGVGPVFASGTKQFTQLAGLDYVRQAHAELRVPLFCIGGIDGDNLDAVVQAGGQRIAVGNALSRAADPHRAARAFFAALPSEK